MYPAEKKETEEDINSEFERISEFFGQEYDIEGE
jgi:hypothetical protein